MVDRQPARRWTVVGHGLLLVSLTVGLGTSTAWAQYPPGPEVTKDGTAVSLQDYASLPLSSRTTGVYPPPINFAGQLGRVNFLRSEPANAPQSSSRFFANDNNRNLYILEKTTKTFTPYINYEESFRSSTTIAAYPAASSLLHSIRATPVTASSTLSIRRTPTGVAPQSRPTPACPDWI
jgi:hypothetical protein